MRKGLAAIVLGSAIAATAGLACCNKERESETFVPHESIEASNLDRDLPVIVRAYQERYPNPRNIVHKRINPNNNSIVTKTNEEVFWIYTNLGHFNDLYKNGYDIIVKTSASWCIPCQEQDPQYKSIVENARNSGFHVGALTIDVDDMVAGKVNGKDEVPWYYVMKWDADAKTWHQQGRAYDLPEIESALHEYLSPSGSNSDN